MHIPQAKTFIPMQRTLLAIVLLSVLLSTAVSYKVVAFYDQSSGDMAHDNFNSEAIPWFTQQSKSRGFAFVATSNMGDMNANYLKGVDVALFLNSRPWDGGQQQAFKKYVENGGGWIGFHATAYADNSQGWNWFSYDFLGCGKFKSNTWGPTAMTAKTENKGHALTKGLPDKFKSPVSEWYGWEKDLRQNKDIKILWSIDQSSFPVGTDPNQSWYSGYYPICWTNTKFNMMYCNFGHNDMDYAKKQRKSSTFTEPTVNTWLLTAIETLANKKTKRNIRTTE